ncbi:glycerol-3-phosphate 1-O-acyltransferase PlsY [Mesotoga sp.]|jgi:glycerol-3-phosphate acyltransferase PlsY
MEIILSAIFAYLVGSIPTAYLIGRLLYGFDIRKHGTGNMGASNMVVVKGWKIGILTGAIDFMKGMGTILIIKGVSSHWTYQMLFIAASFAAIGHMYPIFLKFRGGKGTATLAGGLMGLDYQVALICMVILLIFIAITDYAAPGVIAVSTVMIFLFRIFGYRWGISLLLIPIAVIMIARNLENIQRILRGEEPGLRAYIRRKKRTPQEGA